MKKLLASGLSFVVLAVVALAAFNPVSAATITVNSPADSGSGSLRDAITTASSGDTINFSITGTITLTSGVLSISKNLTITGPGATSLTVSGNNASQVFNISGGTVNISGLTVSNGNNSTGYGGGIYNNATLTLTNVTISGNSATEYGGGIQNDATLTLTNVTISGNTTAGYGGAIQNDDTATLTDVTISGNSATEYGGGIQNDATLTLTNVTISGNTTAGYGGAIQNDDTATLTDVTISGNSATEYGGGIQNDATLTLTNVTISGNTTAGDGGGIYNNDTATLENVTISGNSATEGGGIYNDDETISLLNTIVANSPSGGNCFGPITSLGYNLDSANTCAFTGTGDLINTNPLLGPLALNAPGTTETLALLAGSPAIDAADPTIFPPTDQRGMTRPQGPRADIGAYEFAQAAPATTVTVTAPTMTEWGMIILVILLGTGSVYYLKRRRVAN